MIQTLKQNAITLWSLAVLVLAMFAIPASAQVQLLHPTNSVWRYQTNRAAQQEAVGDWVNPGFNDSTWPQGQGLFGNDSGYPYPMNTSNGHSSSLPIAIYYRSRFSWSGSTAGVVLTGTNYVDDGSIIYLNGVEIARFNMASTANASTPEAQAPVANPGGYPNVNGGEPVLVRLEIALGSLTNGNPNPLLIGDNVIAVQVHQSGAGSDRVFGLALYGGYIEPCFLNDTQLTNRVILRGRSTTFLVSGSCVPAPTFQWYRNVGLGEELILGATGASYTLTNARTILDSGQYYVKATHPTGTQVSRQATLRVDHDDIRPNLVSARLGGDTFEVIARVDEPLCTDFEACGTDSLSWFNWEIVSADNPMESLVISSITMNSLNVIFTLDGSTPWKLDTRYTVRAVDLGGRTGIGDLYGNPMAVGSSAITPAAASAISVKWPFGSDLYTFDEPPYFTEFSTFTWFGENTSASTAAALDGLAQALDVSLITQRLPEATGNPPGTSRTALYASDTKNLITRPTSVLGNVIVAHLRNDTGLAHHGLVTVTYTLTDRNPSTSEEIAGHLVYYSFSGAPNTWSPIYGLYNNAVSGSKTGFFDVEGTPWPAGADMYILFADDNAVGLEGIYEIDNFQIRVGHIDPPPDTNGPTLTRAFGPNNTTIVLTFSERMAASDGTTAPYSVSGATVIAASLNSAGEEVTLVTTPRPVGNATVTITGLYDNSAQANLIAPNPTTFNLTTVQKVVNWNASWEYNTNNLDTAPDWTTTDGKGWQTGNGFFGTETSTAALAALPVPIATPIPPPAPDMTQSFLTSYYRRSVFLPALATGQSYAIGHYTDDGAVFYLDGAEIGRFNMPAGPVTYSTLAAFASMEGALHALPFTASEGAHVLAVEIHQNSLTSADTVFGAAVIIVPTASPSLTVVHSGTNAVVGWNADSSWSLVGSTSIAGPYVPVAGAGLRSFSRPIATPTTQFYKLNYVPQP